MPDIISSKAGNRGIRKGRRGLRVNKALANAATRAVSTASATASRKAATTAAPAVDPASVFDQGSKIIVSNLVQPSSKVALDETNICVAARCHGAADKGTSSLCPECPSTQKLERTAADLSPLHLHAPALSKIMALLKMICCVARSSLCRI